MKVIHGEQSHTLETPELSLAVTARGGHLAPVVFHLDGRDVSPYALAPWEPAQYPELPPLLSVLRGDFLCLPFGGQDDGPPHGDPANAEWNLTSEGDRELILEQTAADSGAHVVKTLSVKQGQHAVFAEHRISNLEGDYNYGTHPVLDLSGLAEGAGRVSVSPFKWASTFPGCFSNPDAGETQALAQSAEFDDLSAVALADGGITDLTRYPLRPGNDDLVMMATAPATAEQPFGWSAVVMDGYVWFALKNVDDFPCTLFWLSNGGRSAAPWNSEHRGRLGIEEVCSYFSNGVVESRENPLSAQGIPTVRRFKSDETVSLRMIHAVALVPDNFGKVTSILPHGDDAVILAGDSGARITIPLDWKFLENKH